MKIWKKPIVMMQSLTEITKHIKANAGTCLNRFFK